MVKNPRSFFCFFVLISILVTLGLSSCNSTTATETVTATVTETTEDPHGSVRGKVLTDSGEMVTAGIIVEDEAGNTFRTTTNEQSGYNLLLPPGSYTLYFTRGFEYSVVTKKITVESYKKYYLQDVRLIQLYDSYAQGWIASDLHQHTYYSDGVDSVSSQLLGNISNGLYIGFLTDHNTAYGLAEWVQGNRLVANIDQTGAQRKYHAFEGVEVTTEFGHFQSLGVGQTFDTYEIKMTELQRGQSKAEKDVILKDMIRYIADTIKRSGGVAQINHPYSSSTMGFNYWDIADIFDTVEIWNGYFVPGDGRYIGDTLGYADQNYSAKMKWFELLNNIKNGGKFLAATGGTDNHDSTSPYQRDPKLASYNINNIKDFKITNMVDYQAAFELNGRYNGNPTTYLHIPGDITLESVQNAIKNGNSFISNGPILIADVNGKSYGETVDLDGAGSVSLNLKAFARDGFESIRIVKNGEVVQTIDSINGSTYEKVIRLSDLKSGDWIVLEGMGVSTYYCITNPIFFK